MTAPLPLVELAEQAHKWGGSIFCVYRDGVTGAYSAYCDAEMAMAGKGSHKPAHAIVDKVPPERCYGLDVGTKNVIGASWSQEPPLAEGPPHLMSDDQEIATTTQTIAQLSAGESILAYKKLVKCFTNLSQLVCKEVARHWIKAIEPNKKSVYPYIGGQDFKPWWWPSDVRHLQPDHLWMRERIALLINILMEHRHKIKLLRESTLTTSLQYDKQSQLEVIFALATRLKFHPMDEGTKSNLHRVYVQFNKIPMTGYSYCEQPSVRPDPRRFSRAPGEPKHTDKRLWAPENIPAPPTSAPPRTCTDDYVDPIHPKLQRMTLAFLTNAQD